MEIGWKGGRMNIGRIAILMIIAFLLLNSCNVYIKSALDTPFPTEFLPTVIAMTLDASGIGGSTTTSSKTATPSIKATLKNTETEEIVSPKISDTATNTGTIKQTTITLETMQATITIENSVTVSSSNGNPITATSTLEPEELLQIDVPIHQEETLPAEIPEARAQIYQLGELSMVTSPILVTGRLTSKVGKVVRIELHGEDGRLLSRELRIYENIPWNVANLSANLEFELSVVAEVGRLVISVEDSFGRLIDVNSVDLILLSEGVTELHPASALLQRIIIEEPTKDTLIQGGNLIVSGRARTNGDQSLRAEIVTEDGKVVGQRLVGVSISIPGDYGQFAAEIPYNVDDLTPALLIIYEDGGQLSPIAHLACQEVILAP